MKVLYSILLSVMMVVTGQTFLKYGLIKTPLVADVFELSIILSIFTNPFVMGGLVLIGLSSIIWLSVLSKADISYAYPMFGIGYVIVALLSLFFFLRILDCFL